ncbi:membrane protein insertion efficiency factor YidD [bacterium]|nr:membrane protein insertion efficiency factor YidD [bacterium]|tara:strand:- start:231 stop:458 length:228 start_codon:yes stop_codon:yes gene_type:complete
MLKGLLIFIIRLYQWLISPFLGPCCRYEPSCSEYTVEAFKTYNPLKAFWLSFKRILSCHPWSSFGYDPLPKDTVS